MEFLGFKKALELLGTASISTEGDRIDPSALLSETRDYLFKMVVLFSERPRSARRIIGISDLIRARVKGGSLRRNGFFLWSTLGRLFAAHPPFEGRIWNTPFLDGVGIRDNVMAEIISLVNGKVSIMELGDICAGLMDFAPKILGTPCWGVKVGKFTFFLSDEEKKVFDIPDSKCFRVTDPHHGFF